MRRMWLKYQLWMSGYCFKHGRQKVQWQGVFAHGSYCPLCQIDDYNRWKDRLRSMREEYQESYASR